MTITASTKPGKVLALTAWKSDFSLSTSESNFFDANTLTGTRISDLKSTGISHSKSDRRIN
jgi:hypothetical protein